MLSPILRVNINTGPRVPISPQMRAGSLPVQLASPHLHPTNLNGTVSPASVCVELHLHAHSPHIRPTQLGPPQFHPQPLQVHRFSDDHINLTILSRKILAVATLA
jgi:hypothetical protein